MRMRRNIFITLTVLCAALLVGGGHASALSLEDAIEMALESSESAGIIADETAALRAGANAGVSPFKPQFKLDAGYYKLGTNAAVNPVIPQYERMYEATLSAAQVLWAGGRVLKGFKLRRTLDSQAGLSERMKLSALRFKTASLYYSALYQKARLDVLHTVAGQRGQELADASALVDAGLAGQLDARHAQVALNMAKSDAHDGEVQYMQALVDLNIEIGADVTGETMLLQPEGELARAADLSVALSRLEELLRLKSLPELQMWGLSLKEAGLRQGLANGRLLPELTLVASAATQGPETSLMDDSWMAGVNLKFDFYDGGLRGAERAQTRSIRRRVERQETRAVKLASGRVMSMRMRGGSLLKRIKLNTEAMELSGENYSDARARYREGLITIAELGQYNLALSQSRLALLGLYLHEQLLMSETELLMGKTR